MLDSAVAADEAFRAASPRHAYAATIIATPLRHTCCYGDAMLPFCHSAAERVAPPVMPPLPSAPPQRLFSPSFSRQAMSQRRHAALPPLPRAAQYDDAPSREFASAAPCHCRLRMQSAQASAIMARRRSKRHDVIARAFMPRRCEALTF